jgi:hypothetical protein
MPKGPPPEHQTDNPQDGRRPGAPEGEEAQPLAEQMPVEHDEDEDGPGDGARPGEPPPVEGPPPEHQSGGRS